MAAESIALPLPLPLPALKVGLVMAFLLHIVFVNMMVGGTLITLHAHWLGRKDAAMLKFANQLLGTVTVHKSIAVVLGVAPLLLISLAYTTPFYTSSVLVAPAWLSVLWLVTLAFLLLYAYKFGWENWRPRQPLGHALTGLGAGACFLAVPLIYLTNTNLMLDAAAMQRHVGFFEALLTVGNVLPRYAHFMFASLAITGFWIALWWDRPSMPLDDAVRAKVVRFGIKWALFPTALQFLAGPVVLFTLPQGAITPWMVGVLAVGILAGAMALFTMLDSLRGRNRMKRAALLLLVTVACMGTARHLIREALLSKSASNGFSGVSAGVIVNVKNCEEGRAGHDDRTAQGGTAPPNDRGRIAQILG